ncbi:MAG: excinuclease ABC subunit UvrA [Trueperaceae bacterium]|nr:excinuclease ABC subunit UvrA [Trueperaceae bacterium]
MQDLTIRGAREHNLKDVDITLPRNAFIVFTGVSGSGKSTLAFDTIYAEGQRRYVESLSAYARQFLGVMDKPDVDAILGLSPAISIDQKTTSHNPRSTVGTVTEIHDYLRLLFARAGTPHCPECGREITRQSPSEIVDRMLERYSDGRAMLLAPVVRRRKGEYKKLFEELKKEGFARVRVDGVVQTLDEALKVELERYEKHDIDVVVDRVVIKEEDRSRLAESTELALARGDGLMRVWLPDREVDELFSERFACPEHGTFLEELEPRVFSFNSPYGACPHCSGLGFLQQFDPDLVVPDTSKSLARGAIVPWTGARDGGSKVFYWDRLRALADNLGFELDARWKDLPEEAQQTILYGSQEPIEVVYRRGGKETMRFKADFEGVIPNLDRRLAEAGSETARERLEAFMSLVPCGHCGGTRYKREVLAVTVAGRNIAEVSGMTVLDAAAYFGGLNLAGAAGEVAKPIMREVSNRLGFLEDVGLDYLSLDRSANTLSGGEAQRIRLATQVGSGLTGVLYVLDEPSIGLHPRDNARLLRTLKNLRDLGNTLIVVEHDEDTMRAADWIVDLGPGAGVYGGEVVASGTPDELAQHETSLTAAYLRGDREIATPTTRRDGTGKRLTIKNAREHNLKNLDVELPLGTLTCITGASGSGKSTLVHEILHKSMAKQLYRAKASPGAHDKILGTEHVDKVIEIDQSPIGRTPRSNPATYTGIFTEIRDLFARAPEARKRGYKPGRFSFNVKGGRCEACKGDGTVKVEMYFLPDVYVPCEVCKGARYNRETLEVKIRGRSISDVLEMTVEEGLGFFENIPSIARKLQLMKDVGLEYAKIGQPSPTLSGGEAQRVKLASELGKRSTGRTLYILDEPTTGLHFDDVQKLLNVLHRLVEGSNTVLVIEHDMDVIKTSDWIVDLGPAGGAYGGELVATGTPEQVAANPDSSTGAFLRKVPAIAARLGIRDEDAARATELA